MHQLRHAGITCKKIPILEGRAGVIINCEREESETVRYEKSYLRVHSRVIQCKWISCEEMWRRLREGWEKAERRVRLRISGRKYPEGISEMNLGVSTILRSITKAKLQRFQHRHFSRGNLRRLKYRTLKQEETWTLFSTTCVCARECALSRVSPRRLARLSRLARNKWYRRRRRCTLREMISKLRNFTVRKRKRN